MDKKAASSVFLEQTQKESADDLFAPPAPSEQRSVMQEEVAAPSMPSPSRARAPVFSGLKTSEELQIEKEPVRVRETGVWFWRRVIVPPNAYVVHTRINRAKPISLGMGISFRYKRNRDAYQVVPGAVQTIGVVANCITREKQGINVLAYLQWQIDDFAVAYKKLDVSDSRDPLGIVNAQLREQAEAAIKDKIATMSVEEVLTDKAPVIQELTTRLKQVTEGPPGGDDDDGLGIKIITVQIREALVSSQTLWTNLQAPFRHEKEQQARISALTMQDEIRRKELEARKNEETEKASTEVEIERTRQLKETEALELQLKEESTRFARTQEAGQARLALEEKSAIAEKEMKQRLETKEKELELARQLDALRIADEQAAEEARLQTEAQRRQSALEADSRIAQLEHQERAEARFRIYQRQTIEGDTAIERQQAAQKLALQRQEDELAAEKLRAELERSTREHDAAMEKAAEERKAEGERLDQEVRVEQMRQEVRNIISSNDLASRLIAELPHVAEALPEIKEMRVIQTGPDNQLLDSLASFVARFVAMAEGLGIKLPRPGAGQGPASP